MHFWEDKKKRKIKNRIKKREERLGPQMQICCEVVGSCGWEWDPQRAGTETAKLAFPEGGGRGGGSDGLGPGPARVG